MKSGRIRSFLKEEKSTSHCELDPGLVRRVGGVRDQGVSPQSRRQRGKDKETSVEPKSGKDFRSGVELDSEPPLYTNRRCFLSGRLK